MKLENATVQAVNLSTAQGHPATITVHFADPTDETLMALMGMVNKPVTGSLAVQESHHAAQ